MINTPTHFPSLEMKKWIVVKVKPTLAKYFINRKWWGFLEFPSLIYWPNSFSFLFYFSHSFTLSDNSLDFPLIFLFQAIFLQFSILFFVIFLGYFKGVANFFSLFSFIFYLYLYVLFAIFSAIFSPFLFKIISFIIALFSTIFF